MIFQKGYQPIVKGIKQINDAVLSDPGERGTGYAQHITNSPPAQDFQTFLRPCDVNVPKVTQWSQKWIEAIIGYE